MGFFPTATEVILQEHRFRPITGRALMIGRQNTGLTPGEAKHLIERNGIPLLRDDFEIEKNTIHSTGRDGEITDRAFFAAFSNCSVEAIDVSDYESAEIVHDMSVPIPDHRPVRFYLRRQLTGQYFQRRNRHAERQRSIEARRALRSDELEQFLPHGVCDALSRLVHGLLRLP
jgi:hypothetical protein